MAKRRQNPAFATVRHRAHALAQTQVLKTVLPPARFFAVHGPHQFGSAAPADLLRPLADRSQPSRGEGHLGHRAGPALNPTAVPKQPALAVAAYSALLLAALKVFGAERSTAYAPLPKWRRNARRPSCLDLITLLRKEASEHPHLLAPLP